MRNLHRSLNDWKSAHLAFLFLASSLLIACQEADETRPPQYDFTRDFSTWHEQDWNEHLSHLRGKPGARALEIGCFEGRTTIWLAENIFNGRGAQVDCIDLFGIRESEERCRKNIAASPVSDRIRIHKGPSQFVIRDLEAASFDFVYVDGCHLTHCALTDLVNALTVAKEGGIVMLDDYQMPSVRRAAEIFTDVFKDQITVLYEREGTPRREVGVGVFRLAKRRFSHPWDAP